MPDGNRCGHCPVREGLTCKGEGTGRFCELVDPEHPDHNPRYVPFLKEKAGDSSPSPAPVGPSLVKRAGNFTKAMTSFVLDGFGRVDAATKAARLEKCRNCSYNKDGWCQHEDCGCWLESKTSIASQACPIGEWDAVSDDGDCEDCG